MTTTTLALALLLSLPQEEGGRRRIDAEIGKARAAAGVTTSPRADDAEFLRRVFLDVVGTIPSLEEAERFLSDGRPDKRERLIDDLLTRATYARNWAHVWASAILGNGDVRYQDNVAAKLPSALEDSFARNVPLDEFARWVVSYQSKPPAVPKQGLDGLSTFYYELFIRAGSEGAQALGGKFTRIFLGYPIQCARCHDHPFDKWTQEEFYGIAAFFAGAKFESFGVGDRPAGQVKNLAMSDPKAKRLPPSFLESREVPRPGEQFRAAYARILTDPSTAQFARASVNRVWASMFGRGLVTPVDSFSPSHPATHPELLDKLAAEFRDHGYDQRWLIREICSSETYQRSGRAKVRDREHERHYAAAPIRALRTEQLVDSILVATGGDPGRREKALSEFRDTLGYDFGSPGVRFQGGIPVALLMLNGKLVAQGTTPSSGVLGRILKSTPDERRRLEAIYLAALSRFPRDEERSRGLEVVRAKGDAGFADVFASLLNSAEFLLSH